MKKYKELTEKEASEKMELIYIEMESGFHIAIDATYVDQIGDFKLILPTGEKLDTTLLEEGLIKPIKTYYIQYNIGKVKYAVSFHDGIDTHKDGSPFFGIATFSNKRELKKFTDNLISEGYLYK